MHHHAHPPVIDPEAGLADADVARTADPQAQYDLVLAHHVGGAISLARDAELLGLPWLDLRTRFLRLDVTLRSGPADLADARAEVDAALAWDRAGE